MNINKKKHHNEKKFTVLTLGCPKNVVDSENLISKLISKGFKFVDNIHKAQIILINTCGFIEPAIEENIELINSIQKLKETKTLKKIIVFGCLVERIKNTPSLALLPKNIDLIYGVNSIEDIVQELTKSEAEKTYFPNFKLTPPHYSYIKIAEGCDRQCSFCTIPQIRGKYKSRRMKSILEEAHFLMENETKEIILIAQDTTYYGMDLYKKQMLPQLIKNIAKLNENCWIRLLYTYPQHFPFDLLKVMKDYPNFCKYLDLPLQHISDNILKSMKRGISSKTTYKLIEKIKKEVPEITIRTTFIVGYPLETQKEFNELKKFIEEVKFDKVAFFPYYAEDIAPSYALGDTVPHPEKLQRIEELINIQLKILEEKNREKCGKEYKILIDEKTNNHKYEYIGRTEQDAPEIDYAVLIQSAHKLKIGNFYKVKIKSYKDYDLIGVISNEVEK